MASIQNTALKLSSLLKAAGISKFALSLTESEKRELNTEHVNFSLYRTLFDRSASVTAYLDGRKGSASGNDLTDEGLMRLVEDAKAGALSSGPDEANDIAPRQEPQVFENGPLNPDMEGFYDRLVELIDTVSKEYPLIRLGQIIGSHTRTHRLYLNSNGTCFEKYACPVRRILDLACGTGSITVPLAAAGYDVTGLDLSAEMLALAQAFAARGGWRLNGTRLYVTKEPCPMCAGAIVLARVGTVVWGVSDPKRGGSTEFGIFAHPGINHHPAVVAGVEEEASRAVLVDFFRRRREEGEREE